MTKCKLCWSKPSSDVFYHDDGQVIADNCFRVISFTQQRFAKTPPSLPTSLKLRRSKKATADEESHKIKEVQGTRERRVLLVSLAVFTASACLNVPLTWDCLKVGRLRHQGSKALRLKRRFESVDRTSRYLS